jgi:hypothetical protein
MQPSEGGMMGLPRGRGVENWQSHAETITVSAMPTGEESDLAVLVEIDGDEHWLPWSQIVVSDDERHGGWLVVMPEWLARREGIV